MDGESKNPGALSVCDGGVSGKALDSCLEATSNTDGWRSNTSASSAWRLSWRESPGSIRAPFQAPGHTPATERTVRTNGIGNGHRTGPGQFYYYFDDAGQLVGYSTIRCDGNRESWGKATRNYSDGYFICDPGVRSRGERISAAANGPAVPARSRIRRHEELQSFSGTPSSASTCGAGNTSCMIQRM
ncbi:DUF6289 family protein [Marilutibacter chinensis]|uniref:DUF6289 family protein n=1 Tax=Marilutibacter chinensis TaxID=2912247 RepID=UPI003CCDCB30